MTTLMLRNIPSHYTKDTLIAELEALHLQDKWDFINLPVDAATQLNVGCAYMNCRTPSQANIVRSILLGHSWFHGPSDPAEVADAVLQGYDANLRHCFLTSTAGPGMNPWLRSFVVNCDAIHTQALLSNVKDTSAIALKSNLEQTKPDDLRSSQDDSSMEENGLSSADSEIKTTSDSASMNTSVTSSQSELDNNTAKLVSWATLVAQGREEVASASNVQRRDVCRNQSSTVGVESAAEALASPLGLEWPTLST